MCVKSVARSATQAFCGRSLFWCLSSFVMCETGISGAGARGVCVAGLASDQMVYLKFFSFLFLFPNLTR